MAIMDSALVDAIPSTLLNSSNFFGRKYELALNHSIENLLNEFRKGKSDFSNFVPVFFELMQARVDPPVESIWFYCALSIRSRISAKGDVSNRVAAVQDLFQLVSACSVSSSSSKSIALLAPVVFEVHRLLVDMSGKELSSKGEKKAAKEIRSLIDTILGYVGACSCRSVNEDNGLNGSIKCLDDLVCFWMNDEEGKQGLTAFFPLMSAEISAQFGGGECDVDFLAGVVIAEAFLLKLYVHCCDGVPRVDLVKELRSRAVTSIAGFQNYYFYETILKMLLELPLPVTSLLSSEEEVLLRNILYDAVILGDYSFLKRERVIRLPVDQLQRLDLIRLIVTYEAVEYFRKHGDWTKSISYINAFTSSCLSSQLIKWVSNQTGMEAKANKPKEPSPKALIKWLLNLEDQGIRIFHESISRYRAKLVLDVFEADYEKPAHRANDEKDDKLLFYIDNNREEEGGNEDSEAIKLVENDGERKRKKGAHSGKKKQIKYQKHNLHDNSNLKRESLHFHDDYNLSGSEIENPPSDVEDREAMDE